MVGSRPRLVHLSPSCRDGGSGTQIGKHQQLTEHRHQHDRTELVYPDGKRRQTRDDQPAHRADRKDDYACPPSSQQRTPNRRQAPASLFNLSVGGRFGGHEFGCHRPTFRVKSRPSPTLSITTLGLSSWALGFFNWDGAGTAPLLVTSRRDRMKRKAPKPRASPATRPPSVLRKPPVASGCSGTIAGWTGIICTGARWPPSPSNVATERTRLAMTESAKRAEAWASRSSTVTHSITPPVEETFTFLATSAASGRCNSLIAAWMT